MTIAKTIARLLSRGMGILLLVTALQACAVKSTYIPRDESETGLRDAAEALGLHIGVAVDAQELENNPKYAQVIQREFSSVVPENALKLDALQPRPGEYSFTQADAILAFARDRGLPMHGHTLVWHRQIPAWIRNEKRSADEAEALLKTHIETVLTRYGTEIASWDVLNEAVGPAGGLHASFWLASIGTSYIPKVFTWARKAAPEAELYYNENDIGISPSGGGSRFTNPLINYKRLMRKSQTTYRMLEKLLARGVPVDGVGLQMHIRPRYRPTRNELQQTLRRFALLGLKIRISELDVALEAPVTEEKLIAQGEIYSDVLAACLAEPQCTGVTIWGLSDAHSWIPQVFKNLDQATLFDENLKKKPAYYSLLNTLKTWCEKEGADSPRCVKSGTVVQRGESR